MPDSTDFIGTAAEAHLIGEFLGRGWNVAPPEIDRGIDLLVDHRNGDDLSCIQVKTDLPESHDYGYNTTAQIRADQLAADAQPPLYYIFIARFPTHWGPSLVIPRPDLHTLATDEEMGSPAGDDHAFYFQFHTTDDGSVDKVISENSDLTEYLEDFSHWPPIDH